MNTLIQRSFINALGTVAYIALVAAIMQNAERFFGQTEDTILAPIVFLTLFVLSAAITGSLVIGKPILMYINNEKSQAVRLFVYTLGWLALALVFLVIGMFAIL